MSLLSNLILTASQPSAPSMLQTFAPMVLIFVIFYFLLIAPARKKQKAHAAMLSNVKNGDRVITNGGIHGVVVGVTEDLIQVRIADQIKIDLSRSAISAMQNPEEKS